MPTMIEAGLPGYDVSLLFAVVMPAATPEADRRAAQPRDRRIHGDARGQARAGGAGHPRRVEHARRDCVSASPRRSNSGAASLARPASRQNRAPPHTRQSSSRASALGTASVLTMRPVSIDTISAPQNRDHDACQHQRADNFVGGVEPGRDQHPERQRKLQQRHHQHDRRHAIPPRRKNPAPPRPKRRNSKPAAHSHARARDIAAELRRKQRQRRDGGRRDIGDQSAEDAGRRAGVLERKARHDRRGAIGEGGQRREQ